MRRSLEARRDEVCDICGSDRNAKEIMICSRCRRASQHIYCMHGQLRDSLRNEWFCEECSGSSGKPVGTKPLHGSVGTSEVQANPSGASNVESSAPPKKSVQPSGAGNVKSRAAQKKLIKPSGASNVKSRAPQLKLIHPLGVSNVEAGAPQKKLIQPSASGAGNVKSGAPQLKSIQPLGASNVKSRAAQKKLIKPSGNMEFGAPQMKSIQPPGVGNVESGASQKKLVQPLVSGHNIEMNDQPGPYIILRDEEPYPPVEQDCWRGEFEIFHVVKQRFTELQAQAPGMLHIKAYEMIKMMPKMLQLREHQRQDIWPKSFEGDPPTLSDIGVYFFGKELPEHRDRYKKLIERLDRLDEALQCNLGDVKFLLFTSTHLDEESQAALSSKDRNNKFLWGLFLHKMPKEQQHEEPDVDPDVAAIVAAENLLLLRSEGYQRVQMVDEPVNNSDFSPGFKGFIHVTDPPDYPPDYPQKRNKLN